MRSIAEDLVQPNQGRSLTRVTYQLTYHNLESLHERILPSMGSSHSTVDL